MSVFTYTAEEQVETACVNDSLLVSLALGIDILSIAIEDVDILCRFVDLVEKVLVHE